MTSLEKFGEVFVLRLPKSLSAENIAEIHKCIDQVERNEGPTALVFTGSHPSLFCGGMDLNYLLANGPQAGIDLFCLVMKLCGRILDLGVMTIAAVNGHAYAGGFLIAIACDMRISTKANYCMSEIKLGMTLPRGGSILLSCKMDPQLQVSMLTTGRVVTHTEALQRYIVDEFVEDKAKLLDRAKEVAASYASYGANKVLFSNLKFNLYPEAVRICKQGKFAPEDEQVVIQHMKLPGKL